MLQLLPHTETLVPDSLVASEVVDYINSYIKDYSCKTLSIDISNMNIIDSCMITAICSTTHYIKYPDGKVSWKISSEMIKNLNKKYDLGNCEFNL